MTANLQPQKVHFSKTSNCLELHYANGQMFELSAEYLRVFSPSAEVRGHGKPVLQTGKADVRIWQLEAQGRYALKISFDDGHDSGLFTWEYLWQLAQEQEQNWATYLAELETAGASRAPKLIPLAQAVSSS